MMTYDAYSKTKMKKDIIFSKKKTCHVTIGSTHVTYWVNNFGLNQPISNFEAGPKTNGHFL
jgi:hypothetical protein